MALVLGSVIAINHIQKKLNFFQVSEKYLFDIAQARRWEKNHFLYGTNLEDAVQSANNAKIILSDNLKKVTIILSAEKTATIVQHLDKYRELLQELTLLEKNRIENTENILPLVSKKFGVSESKLVRALKDTPSNVGMFSKAKPEHIIFIETLITEYLLKNNIVYYGVVGIPLIQEVSHVLKVNIIANLESRIKNRMKLDNVSQDKARKAVTKEDEQLKKWVEAVYNTDITDPNLYDLVINIGHIKGDDIEDALETSGKIFSLSAYS